jgi:hypothetical protein
MNFLRNVSAALLLPLCVGCSGESDADRQAKDLAAANDHSLLPSCSFESMDKLRFPLLSHTEEVEVCRTIETSLGRRPTVAMTRKLSQAVSLVGSASAADTSKDLAYQFMNIVEARDQTKNDQAIDGTFETVFKIFKGTDGHVTPRDINVFLRSAGPMAKTLSDEGLIHMAAVLWEQKKANGQ